MQSLPMHNLPQGVRDAEARANRGTGCDVCGEPATVIVRCNAARFAGFRCGDHAMAVMEYFAMRGFPASADALAAPEMAVIAGEAQ